MVQEIDQCCLIFLNVSKLAALAGSIIVIVMLVAVFLLFIAIPTSPTPNNHDSAALGNCKRAFCKIPGFHDGAIFKKPTKNPTLILTGIEHEAISPIAKALPCAKAWSWLVCSPLFKEMNIWEQPSADYGSCVYAAFLPKP